MLSVEEIRAQYPSPRSSEDDDSSADAYCVGGALCQVVAGMMYDSQYERFPDPGDLADALTLANPALDELTAYRLAGLMTDANDRGNFQEAWAFLGDALNVRRTS